MKRLFVLYDQECELCQRCRHWLTRQDAFVPLCFIPFQSPEVSRLFPGLKEWDQIDLSEKLVVVSDEGAVYQGQYAWIMCLYALQNYREWAQRLSHPALLPFARLVCETISRNRLIISGFLKRPTDELIRSFKELRHEPCGARGRCEA